ncbi:MAG: DNA primase [Pseudomonadota bacterium]
MSATQDPSNFMRGRIPQPFIDDLLDRVDIVDVIDRRVKLKKTGKNYSARCPFHDEKTPSFSVNPEKQFYYCFGCGAGGNALGFIMDYENIEFPQAVENLAATVGMDVPREQAAGRQPQGQATESPHKALFQLLEESANFYKASLKNHPQRNAAVEYLKSRGLTGEIARDFALGFAPKGWDNLLSHLLESDRESPQESNGPGEGIGDDKINSLTERAIGAGIVVKNDSGRVYDRFRERIIFPIRDRRGRVIAFGGRVLGDDKPKYLNSPESPVFHKGRELYGLYEARRANRQLERLIVVEGYMDVIALAQAGISYAVATLGTATSTEHLERIFRMVPEVVFCFDGDEAGRKAAERALLNTLPAMTDGRQARFLFLPSGEDPDTMVRSAGASAFLDRALAAKPLEEYLFESQAAGLELTTMEGRATLSKRVLPLLRQLPEGVFKTLMYQSLADRAGIELESLKKLEVPEPASRPSYQEPPPSYEEVPHSYADSGEETQAMGEAGPRQRDPLAKPMTVHTTLTQSALALLLHKPSISQLVETHTLQDLASQDGKLLAAVVELLQKRPESTTGMLLGHWHGTEEGALLAELAGQERLIPTEGIEAQFQDIMRKLSTLPLRQRIVEEINSLKSRPYEQLTGDDRARLPELIRALRDLDTRSGPANN